MSKQTPEHCKECNDVLFTISGAQPGLTIVGRCRPCGKEYIFKYKTKVIAIIKSLILILAIILGFTFLHLSGKPILTQTLENFYNPDR